MSRGDQIDDLATEKLNAFGLLDPQPDIARAVGWLLLATLTVVLLLGWIWRFRPQIWHRTPALLLIALVLIATVLALKATGDRSVLPYVVPTAAVGLLLAVLLDAGAALIVTGIIALLGGAIVGNVEFACYVLFGGMAGIVVIRRGERLSQFVQAAIAIAIVNVLVVSVFTLLGDGDVTGLAELAGAGVASAMRQWPGGSRLLPRHRQRLRHHTSFQLLELANPSQPLLRRLLLETPGTYHHSLMVGNLAERAAEAIGADPLLARVAAYYHDIGKLANPLRVHREPGRRTEHPRRADARAIRAAGQVHVADGHRPRLRVQAAKAGHRVHPAASRHGADELLLRAGQGAGGRRSAASTRHARRRTRSRPLSTSARSDTPAQSHSRARRPS